MSYSIRDANRKVCAALGLDEMTTVEFTLRFRVDHAPTLQVVHLLPDSATTALVSVLKRYDLTPRENDDV